MAAPLTSEHAVVEGFGSLPSPLTPFLGKQGVNWVHGREQDAAQTHLPPAGPGSSGWAKRVTPAGRPPALEVSL